MNKETVVDQTVDLLRTSIRDGALVPGQRLVVVDLSRTFEVSAGVVREAISRLTGEGMIETIAHRGAVVRSFSVSQIREIFVVREAIEGLAARLAAQSVGSSKQKQGRVQASLDDMHLILEGRLSGFVEHNQQFHDMIYDLSENSTIKDIASSLTLPIYRFRYHNLLDQQYASKSGSEHDVIGIALLAGDGERAEAAMREHIRHSGEAMVAAIERRFR